MEKLDSAMVTADSTIHNRKLEWFSPTVKL
jgi:hypothetical protein